MKTKTERMRSSKVWVLVVGLVGLILILEGCTPKKYYLISRTRECIEMIGSYCTRILVTEVWRYSDGSIWREESIIDL